MSALPSVQDRATSPGEHRVSDGVLRRSADVLVALLVVSYAVTSWFSVVNPPAYSSWGSGSELPLVGFVVATLCFPVVGVLIVHRDPRNTIGWLMLAIGVVWAWSSLSEGYVVYALRTHPGSLPRPDLVAALSAWLWVPAIGLMGIYLILLFPDGHLPSPRWRPVAWFGAIGMALVGPVVIFRSGPIDDASVKGVQNPLGMPALDGLFDVLSIFLFVIPIGIVLSAASLIVRYRRAEGIERLQIKWLAAAGTFVALVYAAGIACTLLVTGTEGESPLWVQYLQDAGLASFIVIPVAIGIAILKHRLYGIDVVINKSVVFGALAAFITIVYVGIVVGVGSLVGRGDSPSLVLSIAATTVVAVAFQPVRARVQRFANRLVYGARATPYEVLSDFADRMGGAYATAELLPMLARTVGQGVGADEVGVWLATGSGLEREAGWSPAAAIATGPEAVAELADLSGDLVVDVRHGGELLGAITVRKAPGESITPTEEKLLADVATQAGLVLRNVRLIEQLKSSTQRLVRTQDDERRRLERNLHDGAQQSLVAVALMIRMIRSRLDGDSPAVGETLDQAADQLSAAIDELRVLARGIHPVILTERGLGPAIGSLAERSPVPVVVDFRLDERPPAELEATLYYVVAEALANVAKHAHATEVAVQVTASDADLALEVSDDGVGGCDLTRGTGILGLVDRVSVVDGTLDVISPAGQGTRIVCRIPLPPSARRAAAARAQQRPTQPLGAGL